MSLLATIERDYISAYKAKETDKVAVLRMLKAAIKNKQVELGREPEDHEVLDLILKAVKQRQESVEQFREAGREDLAAKEEKEKELLQDYLPAPISQEELTTIIDETISELDAQGMKDMGRVMQAVMSKCKGRVDGKEVSSLVRSRLSS